MAAWLRFKYLIYDACARKWLNTAKKRENGIVVPKSTLVEIINRLNKEINAGLADPKVKARFADLGGAVLPGSPADFAKLIADEADKWAKVIKFANVKAE
jgi:tripartite-type tricarboxylate transporter receptor subunit TctC